MRHKAALNLLIQKAGDGDILPGKHDASFGRQGRNLTQIDDVGAVNLDKLRTDKQGRFVFRHGAGNLDDLSADYVKIQFLLIDFHMGKTGKGNAEKAAAILKAETLFRAALFSLKMRKQRQKLIGLNGFEQIVAGLDLKPIPGVKPQSLIY